MTALDALRDELASEARGLPESLEGARNSSRELVDAITRAFDDALSKASTFSEKAEEVSKAEILPSEFTGVVHNYQFGMTNGKPMHRFDMEIEGTGLWLFCMFTSAELDELLMTSNPPIDRFAPETIDGKKVTVRRDVKRGRVVPIRFGDIIATLGPVLCQDKEGKDVREGDEVSIRATSYSYDRAIRAIVVGYTKSTKTIEVRPKKRKTTTKYKVGSLYRFVRIGDEPLVVRASKLGKDREGNDVFVGDFLQLFDNSSEGRTGGIVIEKNGEGSGEVYFVKRVDCFPGSGTNASWSVVPSKVLKLERTSLDVVDAVGNTLSRGDTVQYGGDRTLFIIAEEAPNNGGRPYVALSDGSSRYVDQLIKLDDPA